MNLYRTIKKFFAPKLGNVLNQFNKVVVKLEKVIAHETADIEARVAAIAAHNAQIAASQAVVDKATTVKTNVANLLGQ